MCDLRPRFNIIPYEILY